MWKPLLSTPWLSKTSVPALRNIWSKLLAVPALRTRYLRYVRDIADRWLDWKRLGPIALKYQALIAADVRSDAHRLYGLDNFDAAGSSSESVKSFADRRRAYLLDYTAPR